MPDEPADPGRPNIGPALQLKVRLLEVSPMVWRRLLVPAATSLREPHGIIQVALGWKGIHPFQFHPRALRYGSPEPSASSPEATLESFHLRTGSRFLYEYDLNLSWRHEVRVERQIEPEAGRSHPLCLAGHGDCPAEDSGGPAGHLARQHDVVGLEAMSDLDTVAEVLDAVLCTRTTAVLDDPDTRWEFEAALERMQERECFLPVPFSRREVNARLRRGAHRVFMPRRM
ncbi:MAG TPA: plasmid pRiA4b ORF-3 family protein [Geminicoccaceae bacterium]